VKPLKGYDYTLQWIKLDERKVFTPLWPRSWVEQDGKVRSGAPKYARLLPLEVQQAGIPDFILSSDQNQNDQSAYENITPNPDSEAYVSRWLGVEFEVGANLWVKSASSLSPPIKPDPGRILVAYYFRNEGGCL
jgi:hypothetical protein